MTSTPEPESSHETHGAFHLPPPSIWPAVLAVGVALLLVGLILNLVIVIAGAIIVVASIALWVRDARREFSNLPE
jgi:cytochrome c oxidase subunit IV